MNLEEKREKHQKQLTELRNQLTDINHQIYIEKVKSLNLQQYLNKTISKQRKITISLA